MKTDTRNFSREKPSTPILMGMLFSPMASSKQLRTPPHSSAYGPAQPGYMFAQATDRETSSMQKSNWKQSHFLKLTVQRSLSISNRPKSLKHSLSNAAFSFQMISFSSHSSSPKPKEHVLLAGSGNSPSF